MESISNNDLSQIFKNTSHQRERKGGSRSVPNFHELTDLDNTRNSGNTMLSRTNPESLNNNLLDSLLVSDSNSSNVKDTSLSFNNGPQEIKKPASQKNTPTFKPNNYFHKKENTNGKSLNSFTKGKTDNIKNQDSRRKRCVSQSGFLESLNKQLNRQLQIYYCPSDELHQILYCICVAILPEFSSFSHDIRLRHYKIICERMAYDLDEKDLYQVYQYRKKFNKTTAQTMLLTQKPLVENWFLLYLSDYFNINICRIHESLVFLTSNYLNRPTLLLNCQNRNIGLVTQQGNALHPASLGKQICQSAGYLMEEFKAISRYKIDELKLIATALNIDTIDNESNKRIKSKKKEVIYQEVKNHLSSW